MFVLLAVIFVVFISLGLPDSIFGVSWPVVHLEFGIEESFASLFSIITGVCTGGVSFIAGKLIRKLGTGKVTLFSVILTAAGLIGISLSPNIAVMIIFTIILGYGAGAIDTGLNNFVSLHYKARYMDWLHCFWGVGVTVSPLIMSAFLTGDTGSWRIGYRVIAAIQLAIAGLVAVTLGKWKGAENPQESGKDEQNSTASKSFLQIITMRGVPASILSLGFYCGMEFLVGTWGATYLVNIHSLPPDTAAKWVSLYYGGIMLGRFVSGFISIKASSSTMIRGGAVAAFAGMLVLAFAPGSAAFLGLLLIGFGFGPVFPTVLHSIPQRFGSEYSADLTGFHMGGAYTVGFAIQLCFGYIASATTFFITPFVLMGVCLCLFTANETALRLIRKKA